MKKFFLLGLLFAIQCILHATTSTASSVWQLQSDKQELFIAGSFHALKKEDYPLPEAFERAYQATDQIIFETSLDDSLQKAMQQMMLAKGMYAAGDSLQNHLSKQSYAQLKEYCRQNHIPLQNLNRMKPWLVSLTLAVLELQHHGINPADGVDIYFYQKAIRDNKPTGGLVPVEEHVNILAAFDEDMNDVLIENQLEELKTLISMMDELTLAWRSGDTATLDHWIMDTLKKPAPRIYQQIIVDRNHRWLDTIENLIKNKTNVLIIVGVAHLVGKDSVIELLHKKGYKFEQIGLSESSVD